MWFVVAKMTRPSTEQTPSRALRRPERVMELDPVLKSGSAWRRREESRGATKAQSRRKERERKSQITTKI